MLERLRTIPRQVAAGAIAVVLVLIVGIVFITMKTSGGMVSIGTATSSAQFQDWQLRLNSAKIPMSTTYQGSGRTEVKVPSAAKNQAQEVVFVDPKPTVSTTGNCKAPSAFSAGTSQTDAYSACVDGAKIHDQLVNMPNIVSADVTLSAGENDDIDAATDTQEKATVSVTPEPGATLDGHTLAEEIVADAPYLDINDVVISSTGNGTQTESLWPQSVQSGGTSACSQTASDDISVRETQIENCLESQVTQKIQAAFPNLHSQVQAVVTLTDSASSETVHKVQPGVPTESNSNSSSGTKSSSNTQQPSTIDQQISTIAGVVSSQNISVLLDNGTKAQVKAISVLLSGFNSKPRNWTIAVATAATPKIATPKPAPVQHKAPVYVPPKHVIPSWVYIVGLLLVAAFVSVIFWMVQRQKRLQAETQQYQDAFRREQASFAAADPDDLAREFEALMGPAPAHDPGQPV